MISAWSWRFEGSPARGPERLGKSRGNRESGEAMVVCLPFVLSLPRRARDPVRAALF